MDRKSVLRGTPKLGKCRDEGQGPIKTGNQCWRKGRLRVVLSAHTLGVATEATRALAMNGRWHALAALRHPGDTVMDDIYAEELVEHAAAGADKTGKV